jgi:IstB-like ATP binding protein
MLSEELPVPCAETDEVDVAWCKLFGDRVIATAILDQVLHHTITLNIRGTSYRLKETLKAGLSADRRRYLRKSTKADLGGGTFSMTHRWGKQNDR